VQLEVSVTRTVWRGQPASFSNLRDISKRKADEQALRESEDRFRGLLDSSPEGVAVHQDGMVVLMNPAGARMLGYDTPDATVGMSVVDFLHPDERTALLERMRRVVGSDAQVKPAEARFRRRDGTYLPLEVANARIEWEGKPAVQVVFRDVSARREAERALRESEERFHRLVDSSPDGIAVYQDGCVVMANPACARLLGYDSPSLLVGARAGELVHPDDLPLVAEREQMLLSGAPGRTDAPVRVRFRHRDGRLVHAEVVAATTIWDGAPAIQVMARDVTEQRWLAQVAEETADELYAVLNNSPEAIAAESEGVLVYANQRFARLYGYESSMEVVGRPATDFDAPQDRERLAEYSQQRERGRDAPAGYAFLGLKRDGSVVPMEATISTYRSRGKLHILAFIRESKPGRAGQ
jgi:PAS domain S-box-containing protein